jgi:hypothetical protein
MSIQHKVRQCSRERAPWLLCGPSRGLYEAFALIAG